MNDMVKESSISTSLAKRVKARGRKTRYPTMQGLLDKLKRGEQLHDEYEKYIQPIRRITVTKVK